MVASATRLPKHLLWATALPLLAQLAALPAQGQTDITHCGTLITTPGNYRLATDLSCSEVAIAISVGGVELDLNGKQISATAPRLNAIVVTTATSSVTITGPGTIDGFGVAMYIDYCTGVVNVDDVTATDSGTGFYVVSADVLFNHDSASDGGIGFDLATSGSEIRNSTASRNTVDGIEIDGANNIIRDNVTRGNHHYGIAAEEMTGVGNHIVGNTALGNSKFDLYDGNFTCENDWHGNTFVRANKPCIH